MANDPRALNGPLEKLAAFTKEELVKLPRSEQQRLVAEANSALFRVRKEQQQQAQAPAWSTPSHGHRGGGYVRGRGTYRGRGYRYSPYHHPPHRNSSVRFGTTQTDAPASATPPGGENTPTATPLIQGSNQSPTVAEARKDVLVLNGMAFWKSSDGATLTRVQPDAGEWNARTQDIRSYIADAGPSPKTPETVELGNVKYIRGADGKMHRNGTPLKANDEAHTRKLCRDYTSTGMCRRGNSCHFIHDDGKKAICKEFLYKGTCSLRCFLSHEPSAHNTPPCTFFVRGLCTNDSCRYAHVKVNKDAPVCYQFGELGYCDKGADCPNLHAYECPSFSNTGSCANKRCKLPHVAMGKRDTRPQSASGTAGPASSREERIDRGGKSGASGMKGTGDKEVEDVMESDGTNPEASDHHGDAHDLSDQDDYVPLGVDV